MLWWFSQQLRGGNAAKRLAVVQKLASSEAGEAAEPLIFALNDRDAEVRATAARALGKFRTTSAVNALTSLLADKAGPVRAAAADALGLIGEASAVKLLVPMLRDTDEAARGAAARSLERLGWIPGNPAERVLQILASGRTTAAAAVGPEAVEPLIEMLQTAAPNKQLEAVRALGRIEDNRVHAAMLEALRKDDPAVRIEALGVLARSKEPVAIEAITEMLANSHSGVRCAAVEAISVCGQDKAMPELVKMLKDSSWEVRRTTVRAMGELGNPDAVDSIGVLLADPDRDVREAAIEALGDLRDKRALPALVLGLIDRESSLRSVAAAALRRVDRHWEKNPAVRQVLPQIKAALDHPEYWVRHSAQQLFEKLKVKPDALRGDVGAFDAGALPQHPAFAVLTDMLGDADRDLRLAAVEAFRVLRDRRSLPLVEPLVNDVDVNVQICARQAIRELN